MRVAAFKIPLFLALVTLLGIALVGVFPGDRAHGAASVGSPRVTSITQITHDGFRKTNLLGDDSQLYVTELPAAHRVIASRHSVYCHSAHFAPQLIRIKALLCTRRTIPRLPRGSSRHVVMTVICRGRRCHHQRRAHIGTRGPG